MSNPLPPGAIPKLSRVKVNGQEIGNYTCLVKGKRVNLRTKDYFKARERAKSAVETGVTTFPDDRYDATLALPPIQTAPSDPPPTTGGNWVDDVAASASAGLKPDMVIQDKVYRPANDGTSAWTADPSNYDNSASSPQPEAPKKTPEPEGETNLPPELLEGLIKQAAAMTVELQIAGQEWLAIRWAKIQPGQVPPDSKARTLPTAIWESQFKKWIPTNVALPEWIVAPILVAAMTVPIQVAGATPLKKEPTPEGT